MAAELALDGSVRAVPGAIAMAERAGELGLQKIVVASASAAEAAMPAALGAHPCRVVPIESLRDLSRIGETDEPSYSPPRARSGDAAPQLGVDLEELRGQPVLRRALEAVAAGGHGMLILGPPGAGKSLAARRLPTIMPPLDDPEAMEVLRIASACGQNGWHGNGRGPQRAARPFRAPHHTISPAGLVGGGTPPRAGEVTLAHRGVLFLDELGEFSRVALEALRQPLEDGEVTIARLRHSVRLPSRFVLDRRLQPVPVRPRRGLAQVQVPAGSGPALPQPHLGRARGPHRHLALDRAALRRGAVGRAGRIVGRGARAGGDTRRQAAIERQGCANAELGPKALREHVPLSKEAHAALTSRAPDARPFGARARPRPPGRPHARRPRRAPRRHRRGHPRRARLPPEERRSERSGSRQAAGESGAGRRAGPNAWPSSPPWTSPSPRSSTAWAPASCSPRPTRTARSRSSAPGARAHTGARWRASSASAPHPPASWS